ncbi:MAG: hypothetical protein HOV67_16580 [Kribbellaceae bacterium]|nr:hypothetical protein [Kribbellaceae bacterium]
MTALTSVYSFEDLGGIPRPPRTVVARPRLQAALDMGVRSPLTMVVAPAGTGKTVLLSDWAARRSVAWIPGQEPDGLARALEQSDPIVVDDAQLLPAEAVGQLAHVLRNPPDSLRILLASRHDLPLPVAELSLRGLALTLRARELRFTDAEATELVRSHARDASAEDIQLIQEHTAGWAAALVLAARTLQVSGDAVWPTLNQQPVLDVLLGETFSTLDAGVRTMLLSTFAEETVTARLAATLSGDPESGLMLEDLAANGLLVTAYADGSYRYHPLLVELLRRRAVREDAHVVAAAHHRAALHHENRGDGAAALRSALSADDPVLLTRVLLAHGPDLIAAGELDLVSAAFETDNLDHHLLGVRGLLRRAAGDTGGAMKDAAAASPDDDGMRAEVAILRLWESRYGWYDTATAIDQARELLAKARREALGPGRLAWLLIELAAVETLVDELDTALAHLDAAVVTARLMGHAQLIEAGLAHRVVVQEYAVRATAVPADETAGSLPAFLSQDLALLRVRLERGAPPPRRLDAVVNGARIHLTAREAEVLDQLALGNSYNEIAEALYITENTVKTHLMSLYRKLGVEKRSAALRVARAAGVIPRIG